MKTRTKKTLWLCRMMLLLALLFCSATLQAGAAEKVSMIATKRIEATVGGRYRLRLPKSVGEVTWSSSKTSVATVNKKGLVKAKKKGKAVITAQAGDKRYQCRVRVAQPVTEITFSKPIYVIKQGKTVSLQPSVRPSNASDKELTWSSSDPAVAKVDAQGKVKGRRTGVATITARAKDGSGVVGTCRITVKSSTMKMTQTSLTLEKGQSTRIKVKGAAGMFVGWGSGNDDIVKTVGNGKSTVTITAVGVGTTRIAAYRPDTKQTVYCTVTVKEKKGENNSSGDDGSQQTPSVTPPATGASPKAQQFLALMQKYSDQVKKDKAAGISWTYANSGVSTTWKSAKNKNRKSNCALLARWGLRDLGVIDHQNFWGVAGGDVVYRGNVKEQLLQHCDIIPVYKTPDKLLKEGNLLPGDICIWVNYAHTNVYAGNRLWYDAGRGANYDRNTGTFHSFGPGATINMSGTTISYIIRLR